jgi:hypothetical protein
MILIDWITSQNYLRFSNIRPSLRHSDRNSTSDSLLICAVVSIKVILASEPLINIEVARL